MYIYINVFKYIYIYIYIIFVFQNIHCIHIIEYIYIHYMEGNQNPWKTRSPPASQDPKFCQVVAVDSDFGVFTRAWCMATWMVKEGSFGEQHYNHHGNLRGP